MPTISAKVIKKPRKIRFCDGYRHYVLMSKGQPRMRIYGSAFYGDPPYVLYLCLECASEFENDPKIIAAFRESKGSVKGQARVFEGIKARKAVLGGMTL